MFNVLFSIHLILSFYSTLPFASFSLVIHSIPTFRWAENKDEIWVTIQINDAKDVSVTFEDEKFIFDGKADKDYHLELPLFKKINPIASTYGVKDRGVELRIIKADDTKDSFWGKLTTEHQRYKLHCKVDWDLWVDEDEDQDKAPDADFGMGGMGGMPGMGGMGDMGGMDIQKLLAQMGGMGGMGGMPGMGGMGGMPGMGGMGGMEGMEGMDFSKMLAGMGGMEGMGGMDGMDGLDGEDEGEDDSVPLEKEHGEEL